MTQEGLSGRFRSLVPKLGVRGPSQSPAGSLQLYVSAHLFFAEPARQQFLVSHQPHECRSYGSYDDNPRCALFTHSLIH